jgi:hypothetical protein
MRSFERAIIWLALCMGFVSATGAFAGPSVQDKGYGRAPTITEIKRWIGKVIVPDIGMPPVPTQDELSQLDSGKCPESMIQLETEVCRKFFRADPELLSWAARDTDGDGVQDFMISFTSHPKMKSARRIRALFFFWDRDQFTALSPSHSPPPTDGPYRRPAARC